MNQLSHPQNTGFLCRTSLFLVGTSEVIESTVDIVAANNLVAFKDFFGEIVPIVICKVFNVNSTATVCAQSKECNTEAELASLNQNTGLILSSLVIICILKISIEIFFVFSKR